MRPETNTLCNRVPPQDKEAPNGDSLERQTFKVQPSELNKIQ